MGRCFRHRVAPGCARRRRAPWPDRRRVHRCEPDARDARPCGRRHRQARTRAPPPAPDGHARRLGGRDRDAAPWIPRGRRRPRGVHAGSSRHTRHRGLRARDRARPPRPAVSPERSREIPMSVRAFYDELAPLYHLVYKDWESSVARQGVALASLIAEHWGADARTVLDAALGIGTQALGLLTRGFRVTGSDLSGGAVGRARREATLRGSPLVSLVADFRALPVRSATFDAVLVCDNAIPHLD